MAKAKTPVRHKAVSLGDRIDNLCELRDKRLAAQRAVDALEEEEKKLAEVVKQELQDKNLTTSAGATGRITLQAKEVPRVDPKKWNDVFAAIAKGKHWELLTKRINNEPWREQHPTLPGVTSTTVVTLSYGKVS